MHIKRAIQIIRKILEEDILERYNNLEYWNLEIEGIEDILSNFKEEEREKILSEL